MKISSSLLTIYMIPIVLAFGLAALLVDNLHLRQANLALRQEVAVLRVECGELRTELETERGQKEELSRAHRMLQEAHLALQAELRQARAQIQRLEEQMQGQPQPEVAPQAPRPGDGLVARPSFQEAEASVRAGDRTLAELLPPGFRERRALLVLMAGATLMICLLGWLVRRRSRLQQPLR